MNMRFFILGIVFISCLQIFNPLHLQGESYMDHNQSGIIKSQGFDLGYRIEGKGPNALVIGISIYHPRLFSENLRRYLRLIFTDTRAFAPPPSSEIPLNFDLNLILDDIECVRQKLELGQVIIIGHSGNAFLVLEYAKKYPESVSHVVMIGTGPDFSEESQKAADRYWDEKASQEQKAVLARSLEIHPDSERDELPLNQHFIWNYNRHGARIWYNFNFDSTPLWQDVNVNMPIFDYIWGTLFRDIDIIKGLEKLDKPVFLALGRYDFIVAPPESWDPLRSKFKNLSISIFERSGHSPFYEESELFDSTLLDWLSCH